MATPLPSAAETRCNATYEALMWALSRPGVARTFAGGVEVVIETLVDRECQVFCDDPTLATATGAHSAPFEAADHLFLSSPPAPDALIRLCQGSDLHPEDGATVVFSGQIGSGPHLRLSGPGIDGALDIQAGPMDATFWKARAEAMRYPMGFELFLLDCDRVLGFPRSTQVEVL